MANKKNVETNKKNTEIKSKKSNEQEQKKPTQKKKRRLHSHLKVNIPLFQSLMMILPSLAKRASAEDVDNSSGAKDPVIADNGKEKDVIDDHTKANSSEITHQEAQTSDSDVNSTLNASHTPNGSNSHLVPSHHLSTLSHPQVHYVPSVSMPTISSGSNGKPSHSNVPTTPTIPVTFMPEVIKGTYGELHVDANGQYTFILNPNSPQYILLKQHQPGTDHFALHLSNGSSIIVQIPVTGKQDKPSISGDLTGVVTEDHNIDSQGLLHANGKIDVIDPDQSESSVTPEVISGKYGSLTINADGHWQYQVDNSLSNVQALTAATSLHESFTIHTKDGTPQTIDMTIGGNDDNAVIMGVDKGSVTEESQLQTSGILTITDVDAGEAHFSNTDIAGSFGILHLTDSGKWTYDLDNTNPTVQALGQGSTTTDTITVHSTDGTPHKVTITVRGTNDKPVVSSQYPHLISKTNVGAPPSGLGKDVYEDMNVQNGHLHTGGQLLVNDKDANESEFLPGNLHGAFGELTITSQGTWSYIVDNSNPNINRLNSGDFLTECFHIHTKDGSTFELNVIINGNNDAATVSSATVAIDETNAAISTSGTLTSNDVDNTDNAFTPDAITGTNGDLTIDANGHWTFFANNAFNQLNVGDKVTETFNVTSVDGTPSTVTVTINGTNDKATVSSAAVAVDETDAAVTASGTLTSTDVDNPDNTFTPDAITGTNGDLTIDANGNWTFTANSAFNQLNVGDKVTETFTVSSIDGTPSTIKVTINGTNDKATVSSATVTIDETDKAVTTSGTLTSTDVDNPNNAFTPDSISGTNGDLTIDANGHWTFTANSAFNQLNVGDKVEETFTISSIDGTPSTIKVTINGTNDAATVSTATVAIDETDQAVTTSGTLTSTDVDNPDNTFTPDSISGINGELTIDANGHWNFTANSAFNQLNVGGKVEETFMVSSIDGTPSTIKVTINGTNDAATVSTATVAIDETDQAVTTLGTLTSTDVDNTDNTFTPDAIAGTNGDLTIDANGHWTFTANNAFNQLNVGDKVTETFNVTSVDGTPSTVTVTINGTNDQATVSSATVAVDETDAAVTTSGTLTSTDVDNTDNAFTPSTVSGTNGDFNIDANGNWTFTANSAFNQLNVGDKVTETFNVASVDGAPSTVTVTINGTNDKATVSSAAVGVDETDTAISTSGTLTSTDVDNPGNTFTPDSISGAHGDLTIDANGHWTFTANSAFNQLNVGDKVEETFTVNSVDGTPSTIKVTINGTNDAVTVSSATVSVDETNKAVSTSGTLTSTDVDNPDNTFTPDSISGTNGDLTIDANGHWNFTANNAFNQLNVGDKVTETFNVTSVDGTPSTITVTINGTNDQATVSSATVAVDETDAAVTASGTLTSTDLDNTDNAFTPDAITGTNGDLTIDANGHWTFTANSAFNQLNVGDKVEETFTVSSIDGTPSTIKVTINGTNDKATVSSATVTIDETDKAVTTSGTLTSTDVDNPDNTFTPDSISGAHGDLTIDANGHWTFIANSDFNQLNVGDKVEETFTVSSIDGTPSTIKVTINGTNDAATVSCATVAIDETDKAVTTSGTLTSTDVDNPDNTFTPDSISGAHGDLTIDANGHWTFTANSAFNQLNVGDKVEETFTVSSIDGTPSTIKVTINGTNDAATVSSATVAIDETDKAVTTSGTLTSTDVDNPDNTFTPDSITGTNGDLTIDANGHWNFTANSAFNQLNVGDKVEETFTVSSIDGTPSIIKVTINGTNDAATVSSATVAIDETDKAVTTSGTLTSTDVDNPDNTFTPDSISGAHGDLTIDANGHWTFTANSAFNQLNVGDKVEETFNVTSVDGTPSTVTVTINGTNDKATVSSASVAVDETDTAISTSGTLTSTDVDNLDNAFTAASLTGTNGDLTIDANGHWTFTANSAFNQLNVGDKVEETFTVASVDGTPSTIKVTINGTNDKATVSTATVSVDETDTAISTSGTLTSTDVDNPDNAFAAASLTGTNGDLTIDANGHRTFTANNAFNQLNVGDKVTETFNVTSVDGTPSTVTVTINGTNDKATVSSAAVGGDETDTAISTSGTLTSTDVDNPGNTFTPDSISGAHGDLTIDVNGHWTFIANSDFNQLNVGDKVEETFTVSSIDGTPSTIKVTINGTNDAATVSCATVAIDETDKAVTTSGTLTSTDVDNPDNTFTPDSISGAHGNLTIDANGHWTFTANNAFNQLNVGDNVTETFNVTSVDGTPSTITVTINGTNNQATVSSASVAVDETDAAVNTSGTLTSTDVDNTDNAFTPSTVSGTNGDFNIDANGNWTFTANSAFNQLNVGDKVTETFNVTSVDGTPSTITVTINGTNDQATVSSASVAVNETDASVSTSGTLTSTDVDNTDNAFTPSTVSGTNGDFNINANGNWTFTANSEFNQLNVGDKVTETFNVTSVDGTPSTVTVTINGTNDQATVSSATVAVDETDAAVTTSGTLTSTDVDNTDNAFTPDSITGTNGDLTIDANGNWTFTANSAFNQLNVGDKVSEIFNVTSVDGTLSTVTVTINGTNDIATLSSELKDLTETDAVLSTGGQLTITDPDAVDATVVAQTNVAGTYGHFSIGTDGAWTYQTDTAVDALNANQVVQETFTVENTDGTQATVTVNIMGTNDAAMITGTATGTLTEDINVNAQNKLYVSGQLNITDADAGESGFNYHGYNHTALHGSYGKLNISSDGHWGYSADNTQAVIQALGAGQQLTDTIQVTSKDGTTQDIVITINGTNDVAVITGKNSGVVTEESQLHTSGTLNVTDVDTGEAHFSNTDIAGQLGTLHLTDAGAWTYDLDNTNPSVQALGQGKTATDVITVHSSDGTPHQITITVNGTNDAAIIKGTDIGSVDEGHGKFSDMSPDYGKSQLTSEALYADGKLTITDPDVGENTFDPKNGGYDYQGQYGRINLHQDGTWHYMVDIGHNGFTSGTSTTSVGTTIDQLGEGQSLTDTITVFAKDGTSHDIVVTIHGDNDKPYCSSEVQLSSGKEDTAQILTLAQLLQNTVDVDANDVGKLSIENLHADHGSIALNTDGTYTFTPTQNYNGPVHFTYDVKDGHGGVTHTGATTSLVAVADDAKIGGTDTASLEEFGDRTSALADMTDHSPDYHQEHQSKLFNQILSAKGHLTITDPDIDEAEFQWKPTINGQYGHLSIWDNGNWVYEVSAGNSAAGRAIDQLGEGEELTDTMTVHSKDGTPHDIVITIHGDNDRPFCSSEVILNAGTEDTRQTISVADLLKNTVDVDHNDAGLLTIENLHADHGSIAINKGGSFSFTPEKDYNGDVHFTYDVKDAHGGVTYTGATTSLVAVDDSAKIGGTDTSSLEEFGDRTSALADMTDHSPDYHQEHQSKLFNQILSAKGHLTITDPDIGEAEFQWKPTINGQYGHLSIWDNGNWVYEVSAGNSAAGRAIDQLGEGEELTDTMTVHSKDGTPHDIVITIHGDNDRPYCSSEVILNAGTEDTRQTITVAELLQNTVDVDHNDTGLLTIENLHANHGSIAINKDGSFSFTPEKDYNGDVHFTYDVKDAHGGVTHTGATTSLVAVDDSAKIGGTDTASLEEFGDRTSALADITDHSPDYHQEHQSKLFNQILSAKGHLTITDPDIGEAEFQWKPTINGQYGHLSIWDNGNWVYEVSAGNSAAGRAIDKLGQGEELTDTMTVHSKDGTPHDIVITIHGDNDRPYCSSEVVLNTGTEDTRQNLTVADLLQNTVDVDHNDAGLLTIANLHADHGSIAINKDGSFSFTPEKDYNGDVHFTYDVKDAHGGVTHTGATTNLAAVNDAAIIKGDDTADVHEDALGNQTQYGAGGYGYDLTISGKLDIVDPDQGEDNFPQGHGSSTWYTGDHGGQLIIGATGSWTYNINNAAPSIQRLGLGESMVDTVQVHSADGTTHNIAITIHGTNDAPVLAAQSHSVTEGGSLLKGTMIATDVDHGDSQIFSISNAVDGLTFNADGSYSFDPSNTVYQHLANGQTQTLTIPVTVTDSAGATDTQNLAITITGTNDASVLANGLASTTVTEDQTSSANQLSSSWQNLAITDVDSTAEAAIVQIEVNGVLHQVPADFAMNLQGDHGTFHTTHGTDGYDKWRYTADNTHSEIQGLKDGQSLTDSITLITADGTRIPITATIQGSDDHVIIDTPNAVTASLGTAIEDTKTSISGMLAAHDVDTDDTVHFEVQSTAGSYGTLSVSQDGRWHYDLDPAKANPLTPWDNAPEVFNVVAVSSDGSKATQRIQVNVQGTSDAAIIKGVDTGSIIEDQHIGSSSPHTIAVSGLLTVTDPDAGQDHFQFSQFGEQAIHDPFGGDLRITPSGNWGYSVKNSALQYLHEGDVEHVVYRVHSADGTAHDITITVTGTNDAPALAAQTQSVTEDGSALQGQMQATDADYNAQALLSFAIANPVDGLTFNSDGSYSFDPSNATYQHLVSGQNQTLTIPVTVTDSTGATDIKNLAITITGTNDQPTITSQSISSNEDTGYQFTAANFGFTDVDTGDTLDHISITSLPDATQGQLLLNGVAVTANQDISEPDIAHLTFNPAANFNGDVHFGYTVNDGHVDSTPANTILTVTAVNDIPTVTQASVVATTNEDTPITLTTAEVLQGIGAQDIEGDTLTISSLSVDHATGTLVDNQDGTYTITPNANFHGIIPLTGMVSDGTASTPFANKLMVSSVTDPAQVALSMTAEQQVITLGQSGTGSVMNQGQLQTGDHITQLAFEFNIIGGPQVDSHGIHGATFLSYGVPNEENEFYAWQPSNLTIKIGNSGDIATGINTADGQTHRYSILWDSSSGHLEVLVDGVSQFSQDNVAKGYEIPGHGVLALAQDQDHYAEEHGTAATADHGFSPADAYHGQVFSASVATNTQVDKTLLEHAPLNTVVDKDHGLVIDMQMNPQGQAIDMTGHHQLSIAGDTSSSTVNIDTLVATPNTNALLHLHPQITAPTDPDDHMSSLKISGLLAGTVLSDGNGNSETISNMQQAIEIKDWDLDHLTAQLPGGNKHNMNIVLEATTSGSSGDVTSQSSSPLILDPNNPIPNAQISGSDQGQTSEDSSFSAVLTVNDPDGSLQDKFTDETLHGKYGDLHMGADGHWVYTPGAKAQTLNVGDSTYEKFVVHSADGTDHTIKMTVTGENDTATITGLSKGSVYEDTNPVTTTHLHVNDVDKGEDHFQSATMHGAYGAATISQDGMFTYTLNSSSPSVQALGVGETMTDIVTVTSADGTIQQSVTVTLYGSNDEPTVSSAVTLANGTENTDVVINSVELLSNASDIDNNDQGQLSISSISADHGTITDNHDGTFTLHPDPHYNGRVSLSYDIIDGHSGSVTTSAALDLAAVTPPLTVTLTNDTGTNATDNISKDGHLTIAGQEPGSKVEYSIDGGNTWSSKFAPTEGVNHAQVRQTDAAGNSSPATSFDFTYDTTKPIFTVNHTQDSNQPKYAISGTSSSDTASMTVEIVNSTTHQKIQTLHPTVDVHGDWNLTSPYLTDGSYSLNIYGVDKAGNHTSQYRGAVHDSFNIDTHVAPLTIALTHDTGTNGSDLITNDGSLTITGQETGAHIEYSADGGVIWTNTFTPQTGSNTVEVRQTDAVGNTSLPTSMTFTLDNQVSAPVVILSHDTGSSHSDHLTNNGALSVLGAESNAVVEYSIDNGKHWTSTFSPTEGVNNVQVRQTDGAGNVSPSAAISYTLDTNADIRVHAVDTPRGNEIDSIQLYMSQDVTPTSIKLVDEHGNSVDVDPTMQHGFSSSINSPDHNYLTYRDIDVSTLSGHIHVEVDGVDTAGNTEQDHSGSESVDKAPIPSQPLAQTGIGSSLQADISVHSLSQPNGDIIETMQLYVTQNMTLTSIKLIDEHGHTVAVEPATHNDLGASLHQKDHEILAFKDIDISKLSGHIHVEIDGVDSAGNTVQDHSGSHGVNKVPPAPQVQHDAPDDVDSFTVDLVEDSTAEAHLDISALQDASIHSEQPSEVAPTTRASAYLDALGISPNVGTGDTQQQSLPDDIDIVLAQTDQLTTEHDLSMGLDLSDALSQDDHQHQVKHNDDQDNIEHHHIEDLPDIDPNS